MKGNRMSFFRRIFSSKVLPSWTILLIDSLIVIFSVVVAFSLRYSLGTLPSLTLNLVYTAALALVVSVVFFRVFHTYSNVLRLSSFIDVMTLFVSLAFSFLVCALGDVLVKLISGVEIAPVSVLVITYIVTFLLMATMRMTIKMVYDYFNEVPQQAVNAFIYGTKLGGINIAKSIRMYSTKQFHLKGFIADDPAMKGKVMMGVNVYLNDEGLMDAIRDNHVEAVIVSPVKADRLRSTDIADRLLKEGVSIYTVPEVSDDWQDEGKIAPIKPVQIEDLLGREPIKINMQKIASHLEGRRVLITGAAGSIGSEIMRQVAMFNPYQLILIDQAETPLHDIRLELKNKWSEIEAPTIVADITNQSRMEKVFEQYRPEYVFHAAAYKHVPMM